MLTRYVNWYENTQAKLLFIFATICSFSGIFRKPFICLVESYSWLSIVPFIYHLPFNFALDISLKCAIVRLFVCWTWIVSFQSFFFLCSRAYFCTEDSCGCPCVCALAVIYHSHFLVNCEVQWSVFCRIRWLKKCFGCLVEKTV